MLAMLCRILFFLFMLILYVNVTSTSIVILIVLGYITCVFTYYYFNNVRCAIDECFNYCNFNATKFSDRVNPPQVSGYFVNRKYNKMSNGGIGPLSNKKLYSPLCLPESTFARENNLLGSVGTSSMRSDYKDAELPSPVLKTSNSSLRSNKLSKDKLKISFSPKDVARRNGPGSGSFNLARRSNSNLDLETYMNVNSPGFTSRVVGRATESASYHVKYPTVRQVSSCRFDKSSLRQLSRIPRVNTAATATSAVHIAPPEVTCLNSPPNECTANGDTQDTSKNNNILQVLKDMSRKRNHANEESDRSGSSPKKSRKNETKNVTTTSQYKRAHEDSPNDTSEYNRCKKRCDDQYSNRAIVKMMSYTSGLGVQGLTSDTQSKKRKSSKLEKSMYDSPEKLEKLRKISEDCTETTTTESMPEDISMAENELTTRQSLHSESGNSKRFPVHAVPNHVDGTDKKKQFVSFFDEDEDEDEDEEYVCIAGGKILNRSNCTLRKKLHTKKIDPVFVISTEAPEYVKKTNHIDDEVLKKHILNNLTNFVERGDMMNYNVTLYENSIIEEMANKKVVEVESHQPTVQVPTVSATKPVKPLTATPVIEDMANKQVVEVEVHQPPIRVQTASITQPLKPFTTTPNTVLDSSMTTTADPGVAGQPSVESSGTLLHGPAKSTNPLLEKQPVGLTFGGQSVDDVDSSKTVFNTQTTVSSPKPVEHSSIVPITFSTSTVGEVLTSTTPAVAPTMVFSPAATKPGAAEQKSSPTSSSMNIPAVPSTLTFSLKASTFGSTNPLLDKSTLKTPGMVGFGTTTANAIENASTTSKISIFGNAVVPCTTDAASSSANVFVTSVSTASTTSLLSNTIPSTSTSSSFSLNQPTAKDSSLNDSSQQGGFKFIPSFSAGSAPSANSSAFSATASTSFSSGFTTSTTSSCPTDKPPLFANASSSATSSFSFSAQNPAVFGSTTTSSSVPAQSAATVFGAQPTTSSSKQSLFGATDTQSPGFSAKAQLSSTAVFGASTTQPQSSACGAFGQSSSPANAPSIFGAATRIVGDGDSGTVFGKTEQDPSKDTQTSQFVFKASNKTAAPTSATFGATASAFDRGVGGQPSFGANAATSTFNFSSGTGSFGSNGGASGSTFVARSSAQPSSDTLFNFGSNISAAAATAPQSTFQFRPTVPSQPSQPFTFSDGVPPPTSTTGGFSIGTGGSGMTGRSRVNGRPRKAR